MNEAAGGPGRALRLGNRIAPPRFLACLVRLPAATLAWRAAVPGSGWADAAAIGFDLAAAVFIVSLWPLFAQTSPAQLRAHSRDNDANRLLVLVVTTLLTIAVMAAIAAELPLARQGDVAAIARLVGTLLAVWLFANLVYTLHYAHFFYAAGNGKGGPDVGAVAGGLDFPGTDTPDYRDFAYFAFTLGMTFQTSDVSVTARELRHVVLLHSFAAFVFNLGVIAFTINALG